MADGTDSNWWHYVVAGVLSLALVGLIAYARGEPGDDGRTPEYDGPAIVVVVEG